MKVAAMQIAAANSSHIDQCGSQDDPSLSTGRTAYRRDGVYG